MRTRSLLQLIFVVVYHAIVAAILFASAGRADLPFFWLYVLVMGTITMVAALAVQQRNPDLIREQMQPGQGNQDKMTVPLFVVSFLIHWIIAGLDVGRYHWLSSVPVGLQIVGLIGFGVGFSLVAWSTIINQFYSSVVRLQTDRGQQVITSGPYRFVRHPGYVGWLLFFVFSGIALGSWVSMLPALVPAFAVIRRTMIEDRMLQGSLDGYSDYASRVRYRLIPGLW